MQWGEAIMKVRHSGEVLIKCIPNDCAYFEYTVTVTNSQNKILYQSKASKNGVFKFEVPEIDEYQISVKSENCLSPRVAYRWATLAPCEQYTLYFVFNTAFFPHYVIKADVKLIDQNYNGLPISKGEIFLWQVPM